MRERIESASIPEPNTGCWLWLGAVNKGGYGTISIGGRTALAHRVSFELARGRAAGALVVDHRCRVRHCVNPDHLRAITGRENTLIGTGPTAANARKTTCAHGHDLANARNERGSRKCRKCRAERMKKYRARR